MLATKRKENIGSLDHVLVKRGYDVTRILSYAGSITGIDPLEHDLAIFTGGPMGVYQADIFPYLKDEVEYLQKRIAADKPTLGVCLGAQLIAKALGSEVYPGKNGKEIGWVDLHVNDNGKKTPIRHLDFSETKMMQWHGDTFDFPKGAELLASTNQYDNQAYRYGKNIMAVQFHPEVIKPVTEMWLAMGVSELKEVGKNVSDVRAECDKNLSTLEVQTEKFFTRMVR